MVAEILCVGTELLMGQVLNTNTRFLSSHLAEAGISLYYQQVVGDNPLRLKNAILEAFSRADILLLSGGLGPTEDDLTKETAAEAMGLPAPELIEEEWEKIVDYHTRSNRVASPNNKKQAMFPPTGCTVIPNPRGTAPGCRLEKDGKVAILMPGPPRELEPMFLDYVLPYLKERSGQFLHSRMLRIFGMGESKVEHTLLPLIHNQTNPTLATYAETGETKLRITAACSSKEEGEAILAPYLVKIQELLGDVLYSMEGEDLPSLCHRLMLEQGKTLSTAESLTGGQLASAFIDKPGSSSYFLEGTVSYSNESKNRTLGVSQDILDTEGAVSPACAKAMAEGARRRTGSDYALATTGFAGPTGQKVGLVYVAISTEKGTKVKECHLVGDRNKIRNLATLHAIDLLRRELTGL